ncbi:hypothetical protein [Sphingomonas sp. NCPPB 2930]|uniref:hypothetical protein n=1 Tax=Sphingomonas sp. NCPPB 2930 TaxID=3162788 RepID=UPI0036DBC772
MGYALRAYEDWEYAEDQRDSGMLIDDQYRLAAARETLPVRRFETVTIAGNDIRFDVSRSGGEVPEVVRQSLTRLAELAERKNGWDSYGSARLDRGVVRSAVALIVEGFRPCLYPEISLTSTGGLNLSWECDTGKELEIELLTDGTCDYVYEDEDGEIAPDEPVSLDEARQFLSRLRG